MALHTYTPTEWKNAPDHKTTPINATNLNNIETGIENAYTDISAIDSAVAGKAEKDDLTSISETGSTASQAISAGTYFYLNGTLVRAKTAIANGATFTENTNYEVVTDGALNKSIKYSTEEHVIGNWIDGSTLYEKTFDCGSFPNNTSKTVNTGLGTSAVIRDIEGVFGTSTNPTQFYSIDCNFPTSTGYVYVCVINGNISIQTNANLSGYSGYVTLRYTKTS